MHVRKEDARKLVGKHIYALKKDGSLVTGKLISIRGTKLIVRPPKGKKVSTKAVVPLVLFDLLAIGTSPYGNPYGYYGYGPYGHHPYSYGFNYNYGPGYGYANTWVY